MEDEKKKKTVKRKLLKIIKWVAIAIGILIAFLIVAILIFTERFLKVTIEDFVYLESRQVYTIKFDKLDLKFGKGTLSLHNLHLIPDTSKYRELMKDSADIKTLYEVKLDEVRIEKLKPFALYFDHEFLVGRIMISNPQLSIIGKQGKVEGKPHRQILEQIKGIKNKYLKVIHIDEVDLINGMFDSYKALEDTAFSTSIGKISFFLKDFRIDENPETADAQVLFSEDFEIEFREISSQLKDQVHRATINEFKISSIDSNILINNVKIEPVRTDGLIEEESMYRIDVGEIAFVNSDILKILYDDYFKCDSLIVNKPRIVLTEPGNKQSKTGKHQSMPSKEEVWKMISEVFIGLDIKTIAVRDGNLNLRSKDQDNIILNADRFDVILSGIKFDSTSLSTKQKLILADEADIIVSGIQSDDQSNKKLYVKELNVNTKQSMVQVDSVRYVSDENIDNPGAINAYLKKLNLTDIDFFKFLSEYVLEAQMLSLESPKISAGLQNKIKASGKTTQSASLPFDINLKSFKVSDGVYKIAVSDSMAEKHLTASGLVHLLALSDLKLNRHAGFSDTSLFSGIEFELIDPVIELHKPQQLIKGDQIGVSTAERRLYAVNPFIIKTGTGERSDTQLRNDMDVGMDTLVLNGVDIYQILNFKKLHASDIRLINPVIMVDRYVNDNSKKQNKQQDYISDLKQYLHELIVGEIVLSNLRMDLRESSNKELTWMLQDEIDAHFFGLNIDENNTSHDQLLFCDSINVDISNYQTEIEKDNLNILIDRIIFSTGAKSIKLSGIDIKPIRPGHDNGSFTMTSPLLEFSAVDFSRAYFDKEIIVGDILFLNPEIRYNKGHASVKQEKKGFKISQPGGFKYTGIKQFQIRDSEFEVYETKDSAQELFMKAGMNFEIKEIVLDEAYEFELFSDTLFTNKVQLEITDFTGKLENDFYTISLDRISLFMKDRKAQLKGISLSPTDNSSIKENMLDLKKNLAISLTIPEIDIEQIDFQNFIAGNGLKINTIITDSSLLSLYEIKKEDSSGTRNTRNVPRISLSKPFEYVHIDLFDIDDIDLSITQYSTHATKAYNLDNLSGKIHSILIDTAGMIGGNRFLFSKDIQLKADEYQFYSKDSMYCIRAEDIRLSTEHESITMNELKVIPKYPKHEFSAAMGYQTDRIDFSTSDLKFSGFDFSNFLFSGELIIDKLHLNKFSLDAFRDKSVPFPDWIQKKMPQTMIRSIPISLRLDSIELSNGMITYGERLKKDLNDGEITIEDFNAMIFNITNDTLTSESITVDAHFNLMGEGETHTRLVLPLGPADDSIYFHGHSKKMDLSVFNPMSVNLFGVSITKGKGQIQEAMLYGNKDQMLGHIYFPYKGFKIQMVNRHTGKKGGIGDGILTFLANEILLKSNNPKFIGKLRIGEVYAKRNPQKAVFNYIWKSMLSGIESTLGYNKKQQRKALRALRKKQRKERRKI